MTKFTDAILAVTGASGHLGRRVVELLLETGARHVVALTRNPDKLADLAQRGVDVRIASFDSPTELRDAMNGVERLLLISTDALDRRSQQQLAAVDAAVAAGVTHLLYTSVTSPYPDNAADALVPDSPAAATTSAYCATVSIPITSSRRLSTPSRPGRFSMQLAIAVAPLSHGKTARPLLSRRCSAVRASMFMTSRARQRSLLTTLPRSLQNCPANLSKRRQSPAPI